MLRWMLRVDSWLDVASLEIVEEDHSFLFPKKNLMKIFFFWNLENLNFSKELKILEFFFFWKNFGNLEFFKELKILMDFFFFFWKQPKKYEPNALSPKALFEKFLFFFFFEIWRFVHYQEVKKMKMEKKWWRFIHDDFFFFFEKPILWIRITLAGS